MDSRCRCLRRRARGVEVRESSMVLSGVEIEERVSHTKQRPAGLDEKCRVRSGAFQSRQTMSLVAMGKWTIQALNLIEGQVSDKSANHGRLSARTLPERGAAPLLAVAPSGQKLNE